MYNKKTKKLYLSFIWHLFCLDNYLSSFVLQRSIGSSLEPEGLRGWGWRKGNCLTAPSISKTKPDSVGGRWLKHMSFFFFRGGVLLCCYFWSRSRKAPISYVTSTRVYSALTGRIFFFESRPCAVLLKSVRNPNFENVGKKVLGTLHKYLIHTRKWLQYWNPVDTALTTE